MISRLGYPCIVAASRHRRKQQALPLQGGIERFAITDINNPAAGAVSQSEIPVMFDRFEPAEGRSSGDRINHMPGGSNVLFMDGHVEFKKYPSSNPKDIPVTQLSAMLGSIW